MPVSQRRWLFQAAPQGEAPSDKHFSFVEGSLGEPGPGDLLIRSIYLSVDPAQISWMQGVADYMPRMAPGEVMLAGGVGEVIASNNSRYPAGSFVAGVLGWQDHLISDGRDLVGRALMPVPQGVPLALSQSVLGTTGLTAYIGLFKIGQMRAGDTVLVTGAAGAVGSVAGQLARIAGAGQVVGVAGGADKCRWVTDELGFDACIDYKAGPVAEGLKQHLGGPIDLFFDNVGGEALEAGLMRIAHGARIVICGGISGYTGGAKGPDSYLQLILRRARMEGFVVLDHAADFPVAQTRMARWLQAGRIRYNLDILHGIERLPTALGGLFSGDNRGKRLVQVSDDPTG